MNQWGDFIYFSEFTSGKIVIVLKTNQRLIRSVFCCSWMLRRALWPCWRRPVLRLVNQTLHLRPSLAPARGTRSPAVGHPSPSWSWGSTVPLWRINPASNPTTKAAGTVVKTESPAAVIKSASECPAIMLPLMEVLAVVSSPTRPTLPPPAPEPTVAPHRGTLSTSSRRATNRASRQAGSPRHTARLPVEKLLMSGAVPPAPAAAAKKMLMWTRAPQKVLTTQQTPAMSEPVQTAATAALTVGPTMRVGKERPPNPASSPDTLLPFPLTRQANHSFPCHRPTWAITDLWWGATRATRLSLFPDWTRRSPASEVWPCRGSIRAPALSPAPPLPRWCRVYAGTRTVLATPVCPTWAEATATPASTTLHPASSPASPWCIPPTRCTPCTKAPCHLTPPPPSPIPSTHMASCFQTTPCLTHVTGSRPGGPATNALPRRRSSWPTSAHTPPCLWGWTVSCSLFPPLDLLPATFTSRSRAVQAPCPAPSLSGLLPVWA